MLVVLLCLIIAPQSQADDDGWFRYENDFFIAYSNAGAWQAGKILEDLEYFRAAALRIPNIELPHDTLKTLVLMPATAQEFAFLTESENSVGFAQPLDGRTAIVFPASSRTDKSKYILHHEYAHALAHVNSGEYPQWYSEGFAEIAASVVIHKRRQTFYVGLHEGRYKDTLEPKIDWDELISDQFDAHALNDAYLTASAYAQFWLLAHFLTLSGSREYILSLEHYFMLIEKGEPSTEAFRDAFGMSANELWELELQHYVRNVPEYRHSFARGALDPSFERRPAAASEYTPMLRFFEDRASIGHGIHKTSNPLPVVSGRWDHLRFSNQCSEAFDLTFTDSADVLVMHDFYTSESGQKVPAVFSVRHQYGTEIVLRNITRSRYPNIGVMPNYQLTIRSDDVMCFDEIPSTSLCQRVLHRCNR